MILNGVHAVREALQHKASGVLYVSMQHKDFKQLVLLAKKNNCKIITQSPQEIKSKGGRQGVLFQTNFLQKNYVPNLKQWLLEKEKAKATIGIIILDHILDPQNFGAIVRSANLFGINLIIQPERRMAPENAISVRSASGGMSSMPRCYENNLQNSVQLLQKYNFWIYALDMQGTSIKKIKFPKRVAFILGGEHKGVSNLLLNNCDEKISIPNNGSLESFNVSVSAAIACYEYFTQNIINK